MDFVRKKKRGQNKKVQRSWFSEEGYRIIWRKEVYGVRVPARFQACVRTLVPYSDGQLRPMWDFVNHQRRLIKTLKAAEEECERHKRLWTKACEATGVRALKELVGRLPSGLPLWARQKMDRRLYAILTDNRPGKYRTDDEEDESCTESLSPASNVPGPGGPINTSEPSAAPRKPVSQTDAPTAPSAKAVGRARKKPAAKRTRKSSKRTSKRKPSTTDSPDSGAKRSKSPRKTKSPSSAS